MKALILTDFNAPYKLQEVEKPAAGSGEVLVKIMASGINPLDLKNTTVEEYVFKNTQGDGFDIILDTVGGAVLDASFNAAKQYTGHVASILGWGNHTLAPLSFRGATYSGVFTLYPLISGKNRKQHGDILRKATEMVEKKEVKPMIDKENYTLGTIEAAYDAIANGKTKGKVVVCIQ